MAGDAGARQVFWAMARKIKGDTDWVCRNKKKFDSAHNSIEYGGNGAILQFLWDPWLNSSELFEELKAFQAHQGPSSNQEQGKPNSGSKIGNGLRRSATILISGGLWHARYLGKESVARFQAAVKNITTITHPNNAMPNLKNATMDPLRRKNGGIGDLFFTPVLEPLYDRLSPTREVAVDPIKITSMNTYLRRNSQHLNVLWSYNQMTRDHPYTYGESGLHVIDTIADKMAVSDTQVDVIDSAPNPSASLISGNSSRDQSKSTWFEVEPMTVYRCSLGMVRTVIDLFSNIGCGSKPSV